MRFLKYVILLLPLLQAPSPAAGEEFRSEEYQPTALSFGGYQFGKEPSANMTCYSGYCKSQAPGGDGRIDFPFSVYETPGAVSPMSALAIVAPRYTFWDDRLYRVFFQVDCTPLEMHECLEDIETALHREYGLTAVAASDVQKYAEERRVIVREFRTDSGANIRIRYAGVKNHQPQVIVDIIDPGMARLVATTLNPGHKPKDGEPADPSRQP
ncbi:MAG: hypothetical protein FDZ69_02600 [Deltaproteobacteria bacterium]|nr:MAG: hypothetical protein FDZ69_02600 [Deltaproteobacteria bacterium]